MKAHFQDEHTGSSSSLQRLSFRAHISHKQAEYANDHVGANRSYIGKGKQRVKKTERELVQPIQADHLSYSDIDIIDPGRCSQIETELDLTADALPTIDSRPIQPFLLPQLRIPTSRNALYDNIIALMARNRTTPSSLQTLVFYHSHHLCRAFQSARSFNLLVSLAIRHTAYGTAKNLLSQMQDCIPCNLETWKLKVRLMIRTGKWDLAWRSIVDSMQDERWRQQMGLTSRQGDGMPLAIWLEFLTNMKKGAIRQWTESGMRLSGYGDEAKDVRSLETKRLNLLMKFSPSLTANEYTRMPARAVFFIVWNMLRAGHIADAQDMTKSYLGGLPPELSPKDVRESLDIIHLHIPWGSNKARPLQEHYHARRVVESFLDMHKHVKPDANTLFLLLRSLRRTTYSGTLAKQTANAFARKWGLRVGSERVRRRIATFAIKEGNVRLAENELCQQRQSHLQHSTYATQTDASGSAPETMYRDVIRPPLRKTYTRGIMEVQRWRLIERKVQHMKPKRVKK